MNRLSHRQERCLDFIRERIQAQGYAPTLREIGEHFGIKSTNGVNDHLRALEKKGLIAREDWKSRALSITEAGLRALGYDGITGTIIRPARCLPCGRHFFRGTEARHVCKAEDLARAS